MTNTTKNPLVSIISINFNHSRDTMLMIESLKKSSYQNIEIIVVDNGSFSDTPTIISEKHPDVKLILLPTNLGFSGGNNEGIKLAKGEYILLLNNDTVVDPDFLEPMIQVFSDFENVGMVSPKLLFYNSPDMKTIQYAGSKNINLYTGRNSSIGWQEIDNGQYDNVYKTDYAHGAAVMFSRKVLDIVGCMPDKYFLYYDELDWSYAMRMKGLYPYFTGKSKVYHKESASVGKNSPVKIFYMARNRILYLRRNSNWNTYLFAIVFILTISTPVAVFRMLKNKELHLIKFHLAGVFWHFTHLKSYNGFPKLSKNANGTNDLIGNDLHYKKQAEFVQSLSTKKSSES